VRVGLDPLAGRGDRDPLHEADGLLEGVALVEATVHPEHLGDLPPHREDGVQRAQRVLEDHRDLRATRLAALLLRHRQQILTAVADVAARDDGRGHVEDSHDRLGGHRLAGPGLTEDRERLALAQLEADAVDRRRDPVGGVELDEEVFDLEQQTIDRLVLAAGCLGVLNGGHEASVGSAVLRVEGVAHGIPEEDEAEHRQRQEETGEEQHVRGGAQTDQRGTDVDAP